MLGCNHFGQLLEIYTGRYVAPRNRENPVDRVDSFSESLDVEKFVAVFLSNCDEEPVIGVVKEVTEDHSRSITGKGLTGEDGLH